MPYQREADQIIRDWRHVLAMLDIVADGSIEAERLHGEVQRLRDEYETLSLANPELAPFPLE